MKPLHKQGSCLCGAIQLSLQIHTPEFHACHCRTCRQWGGGPLLSVECQHLHIDGEAHLGIYASSDWAERGFCTRCGSHLFYRLKSGALHAVPLGLLEDDADAAWQFETQIFIDAKPAGYCFANPTRTLTGEQVFAQFPDA